MSEYLYKLKNFPQLIKGAVRVPIGRDVPQWFINACDQGIIKVSNRPLFINNEEQLELAPEENEANDGTTKIYLYLVTGQDEFFEVKDGSWLLLDDQNRLTLIQDVVFQALYKAAAEPLDAFPEFEVEEDE